MYLKGGYPLRLNEEACRLRRSQAAVWLAHRGKRKLSAMRRLRPSFRPVEISYRKARRKVSVEDATVGVRWTGKGESYAEIRMSCLAEASS